MFTSVKFCLSFDLLNLISLSSMCVCFDKVCIAVKVRRHDVTCARRKYVVVCGHYIIIYNKCEGENHRLASRGLPSDDKHWFLSSEPIPTRLMDSFSWSVFNTAFLNSNKGFQEFWIRWHDMITSLNHSNDVTFLPACGCSIFIFFHGLLIYCLLLLPLFVGILCLVRVFVIVLLVLQSNWWERESRLLYVNCLSVPLPHGAVGWSAVCDCGTPRSYSLAFLYGVCGIEFFSNLGRNSGNPDQVCENIIYDTTLSTE